MKWTNTFVVGAYTCEMTYSKSKGITATWRPKLPPAKSLSKQEHEQYRAGRDALMAEVAKQLGGSVLVVEV